MLYINYGRFYTKSISFFIPDNMCLVTDPEKVLPDTIIVETLDGKFQIKIGACEHEGESLEEIKRLLVNGEYEQISEISEFDHERMKGYRVFYRDHDWSHEYYTQVLEYPMNAEGQNGLSITVEHEIGDESQQNQIAAFMKRNDIEMLLNNIRYEPNICTMVTNQN